MYDEKNDVYISDNVEIKRPNLMKYGKHIAIDSYFYCTTKMTLGSYIHISPFVSVIGGKDAEFRVGNFTTISAGCRIICASDAHLGDGLVSPMIPEQYRDKVNNFPVIMEDMSAICTNSIVMPGVTLHEGAVVGANSFVNCDIPEWEIWAGSPAKFIKKRQSDKMKKYAKELP